MQQTISFSVYTNKKRNWFQMIVCYIHKNGLYYVVVIVIIAHRAIDTGHLITWYIGKAALRSTKCYGWVGHVAKRQVVGHGGCQEKGMSEGCDVEWECEPTNISWWVLLEGFAFYDGGQIPAADKK